MKNRSVLLIIICMIVVLNTIGLKAQIKTKLLYNEYRETCYQCYGTGQQTCPVCQGAGIQVYNILGIKVFHILDTISIVCTRCQGSGKITCTVCGGTEILP